MLHPIRQILEPDEKNLGGSLWVRRLLPHEMRQMVGPFIFFDHIGPAVFPPGQGLDVRPHPHINLATLTYLFDGVILHCDSLNSVQEIHPGAVNWMTAGSGITHSERTPAILRSGETKLHGIQTWIALPEADEETDPAFYHYAAADLPTWQDHGVSFTLIAGQAAGYTSPVKAFSAMIYLDLVLPAQTPVTIPNDYPEQAIYSVTGNLSLNGERLAPQRLAILPPSESITVTADTAARCVVVGGDPVGTRYKWRNFVSSRPERIEQAKADWQAGRFVGVPHESEFIPLPENIL